MNLPAPQPSPVLAAVAALDEFAGERLYEDQADVLLSLWAHAGELDDRQRAEVIAYYPPREDGTA